MKNNGTKRKGTKVYDKNAARSMTDILTGVLTSGTAAGHELNNMSCAGKTGTTNDKKMDGSADLLHIIQRRYGWDMIRQEH